MTASKHTKESGLTSYNLHLGNVELGRLQTYLVMLLNAPVPLYKHEETEIKHFIETIEKIQE